MGDAFSFTSQTRRVGIEPTTNGFKDHPHMPTVCTREAPTRTCTGPILAYATSAALPQH